MNLAADFDARPAAGPPPHHILLVEDNPGDADLTCERLAESWLQEFVVSRATTLADAVTVLMSSRVVDAIILDLNLPDSTRARCPRSLPASWRRARRLEREKKVVPAPGAGTHPALRHTSRRGATRAGTCTRGDGMTWIVTGASRGLGRHLALERSAATAN